MYRISRKYGCSNIFLIMEMMWIVLKTGIMRFVVPSRNRVLAEYGIAVMAAAIDRVPAVGKIVPYRIGQEFVLRADRPVVVALGVAFVQSLDLLQKHQVRANVAQFVAQVVNGHAPLELREALVDVVGGDLEGSHGVPFYPINV